MNSRILLPLFLLATLCLSACGGGGGSSTSGGNATGGSTSGGSTSDGGASEGSTSGGSTATPSATLGNNQGQVLLGPIVGASVYAYNIDNLEGAPVCTSTTSSTSAAVGPGVVNFSNCSLQSDQFYLVVVRGGQDIDADDDGTLDATPTAKAGALRAVLTGAQIARGNFRINLMTEMGYQAVAQLILTRGDAAAIIQSLDHFSRQLISQDLNGDGIIDDNDLLAFIPAQHQNALSEPEREILNNLLDAVLSGISSNVTSLARQYLLTSKGEFSYQSIDPNFYTQEFLVENGILFAWGYQGENFTPTSNEFALRVFDVADFPNVELLDTFDTSSASDPRGIATALAYYQDHLYAAIDGVGILIFDVSDPQNTTLLTTYSASGTTQSFISIAHGKAYISNAADDNTKVLDLSNPAAPLEIGVISDVAFDVTYNSGILYLYGGGVSTYDEASLLMLDRYPTSGQGGWGIGYRSGRIYMPSWGEGSSGISVLDVSDPQNILLEDQIFGAGLITNFEVSGNRLYAKTQDSLSTFEITDSGQLELLDSRSTLGYRVELDQGNIYLGNQQRVISYDQDSLNSQPSNFTSIATEREATRIRLSGDLALVADSQQLVIYDISDRELGLAKLGSVEVFDYIFDFQVVGDYAYLAANTEELVVVDVSDPNNPDIAGQVSGSFYSAESGGWGTEHIAIYGNHAYASIGSGNLAVYDISNPLAPSLVNEVPKADHSWDDIEVSGDTLFLARGESLYSYTLSDPTNPQLVDVTSATESLPGGSANNASGFTLRGGHAYITSQLAGLSVVDISNPAQMAKTGGATGLGKGNAVSVINNMAYVANEFGLVDVYDVADSFNPVFITQFNFAGTIKDVVATPDYVFAVNVFGVVVERTPKGLQNLD